MATPINIAIMVFQLTSVKRSITSSTTSEASPAILTAAASAATAVAVGSAAWYYYAFGNELHAMTPAEEGYDILPFTSSTESRHKVNGLLCVLAFDDNLD